MPFQHRCHRTGEMHYDSMGCAVVVSHRYCGCDACYYALASISHPAVVGRPRISWCDTSSNNTSSNIERKDNDMNVFIWFATETDDDGNVEAVTEPKIVLGKNDRTVVRQAILEVGRDDVDIHVGIVSTYHAG